METTDKMDKMDKVNELTNQLLDSPKMISDKLPWNSWTSCIENSENRVAEWLGKIFSITAFIILLTLLWSTLEPLWANNGAFWGNADTAAMIGAIISILLWACAAFPIAMIIRNTSDGLSASKSNIINLIFLDLPVALIKLAGYVLAMVGLFAAVSALLSFITTLNISNGLGKDFSDLAGIGTMGTTILFEIMENIGMGDFSRMMAEWMHPNLDMSGGDAWTVAGVMGVFGAFIAVLITLVNLYINVVVYQFLYGLASTLVKWVKAPYLPYKAL